MIFMHHNNHYRQELHQIKEGKEEISREDNKIRENILVIKNMETLIWCTLPNKVILSCNIGNKSLLFMKSVSFCYFLFLYSFLQSKMKIWLD